MNIKISAILISIAVLLYSACGDDQNESQNIDSLNMLTIDSTNKQTGKHSNEIKDTVEKEKKIIKKNNSKYICPQNDPEGNLNAPGNCPACGMELIENPDYTPVKPK
jgi:predicted Zn-ribbon and HTH transcriptional regulator